jgi:hypothetical protein
MLDEEQRFYLARHLLGGVEGLDALLLTRDKTGFRKNALAQLKGEGVSPEARILGLAALDILNGSGGTLVGEAIRTLDKENYSRLVDALQAMI